MIGGREADHLLLQKHCYTFFFFFWLYASVKELIDFLLKISKDLTRVINLLHVGGENPLLSKFLAKELGV